MGNSDGQTCYALKMSQNPGVSRHHQHEDAQYPHNIWSVEHPNQQNYQDLPFSSFQFPFHCSSDAIYHLLSPMSLTQIVI
jgi:hypothetical protein